jgi:hypothetical protein
MKNETKKSENFPNHFSSLSVTRQVSIDDMSVVVDLEPYVQIYFLFVARIEVFRDIVGE